MVLITATELKNNLSKYRSLSQTEDVYVTKGKQIIAVLTNAERKGKSAFFSLYGVLGKEDIGYDEMLGEGILSHEASH